MRGLWTPWRYDYITGKDKSRRKGVPAELEAWPPEMDRDCVFCNLIGSVDWAVGNGMPAFEAERAGLVLSRGEHTFCCLNAFPYASGHAMILPYAHIDRLMAVGAETASEMMREAQRLEAALRSIYRPDGLNVGINMGEAGGAGVAEHLHMHMLPRWVGDTNFMTVVGETRILPEMLSVTWERLRESLVGEPL